MDKYDEIAKISWELILNAVKQLRSEGCTLDEIAKRLGVKNRAVIGEWINGNREAANTAFPNMLRYLDALNLDLSKSLPDDLLRLLKGFFGYKNTEPIEQLENGAKKKHNGVSYMALADQQAIIKRMGNTAPEIVDIDNSRSINVYASVGAGPAIELYSREPLFSIAVPPSHFYKCNFAVQVDGHSMEPTIPHLSVVGVREIEEFRANELYVAAIPYEGLVVKRVAVDRNAGEFVFKSDNPDKSAYPDFREAIGSAEKIIMGRVVWVWQVI